MNALLSHEPSHADGVTPKPNADTIPIVRTAGTFYPVDSVPNAVNQVRVHIYSYIVGTSYQENV